MDGAIKVQQALYKGLLQLKHADESGRADAEKAVASAVARGEAFLQEDEPRPEFVEAFVKEEVRERPCRARTIVFHVRAVVTVSIRLHAPLP